VPARYPVAMTDGDTDGHVDGRRRRLLAAVGAGAATAAAGCLSGGGGEAGPVFRTFTPRPHERYDWTKSDLLADWPRLIYPFCFDRLGSENPDGTVEPMLAADWSHDASEIRVELAESGWNDGSPVRAADWAIDYRLERYRLDRGPEAVVDAGDPQTVLEATTAVEWDGRTATFRSDPGFYADLDTERWLTEQLTAPGPAEVFRHRSETRPLLDEVEAVDDPYGDDAATVADLLAEGVSGDREDPTTALVSGPFEVSDLPPDRVEMERNPHFRNADAINFPRAEAVVHTSPDVRWGGLRTGTYDAMPGILDPPPANAIEARPDKMRMHRWDDDGWAGLLANQVRSPELSAPRVRQALLRALDTEILADEKHEIAAEAPSNPPGLTFPTADRWVDDDLRAAFRRYDHDPERAAAILQDEGFTRESGKWYAPSGDRWSLQILTGTGAVGIDEMLRHQLRGFGVDASITARDDSAVSQRRSLGRFDVTERSWEGSPDGIFQQAMTTGDQRRQFNLWTDAEVEAWAADHDNVEIVDYGWTSKVEGFRVEQTKHFTLSAPPVGDPDTDERVDYPVVYMDLLLDRGVPAAKRREYVQTLAWVFNWRLPMLPYARTQNLAFQNHADWDAPTDEAAWNRRDPTYHLLAMGRIQATE